MRLIDADEAIINFGFEWDDIPPTREEFAYFLKKQSIIDAVPVVRCRDCKKHSEANGKHYCKFWRMYCPDDSDFFCKAGEREEGTD